MHATYPVEAANLWEDLAQLTRSLDSSTFFAFSPLEQRNKMSSSCISNEKGNFVESLDIKDAFSFSKNGLSRRGNNATFPGIKINGSRFVKDTLAAKRREISCQNGVFLSLSHSFSRPSPLKNVF